MIHEKFNFSDEFAELVLACFIVHNEYFLKYGHVLEPHFFNTVPQMETMRGLSEYSEKYGRYPSMEVLSEWLFRSNYRKEPEKAVELSRFILNLALRDTSDFDYVADRTLEFVRERSLFHALSTIITCAQEGKEVVGGPVALIERALSTGDKLDDVGLVQHFHIREVVNRITRPDAGVPTGFAELDRVWPGGWLPGWLIVPLGAPKSFKTTVCLNLAMNMVSPAIGADVIYFTCEISDTLAMGRNLCGLTGLNFDEMRADPQAFIELAEQQTARLIGGNLVYKEFPAKTATIADMHRAAKQIMRTLNIQPKAIFIDYAETVRPHSEKGTPDWRQQSDVYTAARAMGQKLGCCVIMPDRCNKETVGQNVPSIKSFQGAFEKGGIVDVALGICQTDTEYERNELRYFLFVNRHGPKHIHWKGTVRPELFRITVDARIPYNPAENDQQQGNRRRRRPPAVPHEGMD